MHIQIILASIAFREKPLEDQEDERIELLWRLFRRDWVEIVTSDGF
jgi:hypothetical protein